jgi:hypothetical protein
MQCGVVRCGEFGRISLNGKVDVANQYLPAFQISLV